MLLFGGVAYADNVMNDVDSVGDATIAAGGTTTVQYKISATAGDGGPTGSDKCNASDGTPVTITLGVPSDVTASAASLKFTACGVNQAVTFSASKVGSYPVTVSRIADSGAGTYDNKADWTLVVSAPPNTKPSVTVSGVTQGDSYVVGDVPTARCDVTDAETANIPSFDATLSGSLANGLGSQTATCNYTDPGGLAADTKTATYTIVAPPNTKPSVALNGVEDGGTYEIGSVPAATCDVTDKEDGNSTDDAVLSGTLSHGLGSQTATCDYTDEGGLAADTKTATYTIVDTGNPTISSELNPSTANANDWYKENVIVDFTCADSGSGIKSCTDDTTFTEGADQSVTGTATDWAGNTATTTVSGINIDKTKPEVSLSGGANYYFGDAPKAPTCDASDALSKLDGACVVDDLGVTSGQHSWEATATDKAGNTGTATVSYTVLAWTTKGFYSPTDMGGVVNTVKGGSTVPLKFELFAGATEKTTVDSVKSFTTTKVNCVSGSTADEIEIVSTGGTSLRYDATVGQFIQNWKTPTGTGCYSVKMTAADGSTITAAFKTR